MPGSVTVPRTLFIEISTECNFRCKHCHMWTTKDPAGVLTPQEKIAVIADFASLNPLGEVVLTGGETMKRSEEFFLLLNAVNAHGLRGSCNTNGSYISPSNVERLLKQGPKYLVISLDSHRKELHDYVRGVDGAFEGAVSAIKCLLEKKRSLPGTRTEILTNSVLFEENVREVSEFVEFAEFLGLDGITFQMLGETFWNQNPRGDSFYRDHFFKEVSQAQEALSGLAEMIETHAIIRTTRADIRWMQMYLKNPNGLEEQVCGSHEKNLIVDSLGRVKLCFNMARIFKTPWIGHVRDDSVIQIWNSDARYRAAEIMSRCRLSCGMLNCHRKG